MTLLVLRLLQQYPIYLLVWLSDPEIVTLMSPNSGFNNSQLSYLIFLCVEYIYQYVYEVIRHQATLQDHPTEN
jgi:hypothetical protein